MDNTTTSEAAERVEELEAILRLFAEYSSDPWVREQAQEVLDT